MDYSYTRHYQRYEYVVIRDWVTGKSVMDVGCGTAIGSFILSAKAKSVAAVDPSLVEFIGKKFIYLSNTHASMCAVTFCPMRFESMHKVDVAVAIEVFEHFENPRNSVRKLSSLCDYCFFTTPLAKVTGKTENPDHVAEYSKEDFEGIVGESFEILERKYQTSDMRILDEANSNGSSYDHAHVVQMLWTRSKYAQ